MFLDIFYLVLLSVHEERKLMNRLIVASRTRPVIDLPIFLGKYEFTVVPPSLFVQDDLFYQETEKADLSLEKHATSTR